MSRTERPERSEREPNPDRTRRRARTPIGYSQPLLPNVAVLDRLATFLPNMRAANEALADQCANDPTSADIEHLEDPEGQHIEMVSADSCLSGAAACPRVDYNSHLLFHTPQRDPLTARGRTLVVVSSRSRRKTRRQTPTIRTTTRVSTNSRYLPLKRPAWLQPSVRAGSLCRRWEARTLALRLMPQAFRRAARRLTSQGRGLSIHSRNQACLTRRVQQLSRPLSSSIRQRAAAPAAPDSPQSVPRCESAGSVAWAETD